MRITTAACLFFAFMLAIFIQIIPMDAYADFSEAQCVMFRRAKLLHGPVSGNFYLVDGLDWTLAGIDQRIIFGGTYKWTYFPYGAFYDDCDPLNPGWKTARTFWPPQEGVPAYTENFMMQFEEEGQRADYLINYDDPWPVCAACFLCDLVISNFSVSDTVINPYAGDRISISADIAAGPAAPIAWQWSISGADLYGRTQERTVMGSGSQVLIAWNGTDNEKKIFGPGIYQAEMTAWLDNNGNGQWDPDEDCSESITERITVLPPPRMCSLHVPWGSSANVASGNISYHQRLFATRGAGVSTGLALNYNSKDAHSGPLGSGWQHSYEILLQEHGNGEVIARFGMEKQRLYTPDGDNGYTTSYGDYSTLNRNTDSTLTVTEKNGTRYNFSTGGKLSSIVDRNGNTQTLAYTDGLLAAITDSSGRATTFSYDLDGNLSKVIDPAGNTYRFEVTGNTLDSITYPDGGQWLYSYDASGRMLTKTDPAGNTVAYTYDHEGRAETATDPEGRTGSIAYPAGEGKVKTSTFTDKGGSAHRFTYEVQSGNLVSKEDPQGGRTASTYDENNNLLSETDAGGRTTTYTYDSKGNRVSITNPLGQTTTYTYNEFSQVVSITDPEGKTANYSYDATGNLISKTDPAGATTLYQHDSAGRVISATNALQQTMTITYDAYGNMASLNDYTGAVSTFTHDDLGNMTSLADAAGSTTAFAYDFRGNMLSMTDALGNTTAFTYDYKGNRTSRTDAKGNTTFFEHNSQDQVIQVEDPLGSRILYHYGPESGCNSCSGGIDKLTSLTDANGNITDFSYDSLGRLVRETDSLGNETSYTYDAVDNMISRTDARGVTVQYTYDALDRLTLIDYPGDADIAFTYDAGANGFGRLNSITDGTGSTFYSYDPAGSLIQEDKVSDNITYSTVYQYDSGYNLVGIVYPSGRTISYNRDDAGRIISVASCLDANCQTLAENIQYLPVGPMSSLTYGNGALLSRAYDPLNRLSSLLIEPVYHRTYAYDPLGNIVSIDNFKEPDAGQSFTYDAVSRLIEATGSYGTISYSYDPMGNRLAKSADSLADAYTYVTGSNRLAMIAGQTQENFSYDANGNPTTYAEKILTFNQHNRLVEARRGSETLGTYQYNSKGQRVKKVVDGVTTIYTYDQYGNLIGEADGQGKVLREYIYLYGERLTQFAYAPSDISVQVSTSRNGPLANARVYAFTETGSYTGLYGVTNENGIASFSRDDLTENYYRFRVDYLASQFWSDVAAVPQINAIRVIIEEERTEVTVTAAGAPQEGTGVYLFSNTGAYLGLYQITDANGQVEFDLPVGESYAFRADCLGNRYWSNVTTIAAGGVNLVPMDIGGGIFTATIQMGAGQPLAGVTAYLFAQSGTYLGINSTADINGRIDFHVSAGNYKIRVDYLGYQFWSDIINVNDDTAITVDIPHQDITITVTGQKDLDGQPRNARVYLFTPAGAYMDQHRDTDALGQAVFSLPVMDYKVRVDYLSEQYWSEVFNGADRTVVIPEGIAEVTVTNTGLPLAGVSVYAFTGTGTGTYLDLNGTSNGQGKVSFRLPQGQYNFRADYQGNRYWSGPANVSPHTVNPVALSTGGGHFTLIVQKNQAEPVTGSRCYLFNDAGSYLMANETTDGLGRVSFNLADGSYRIRVDYLGQQFWTEPFTVPAELEKTLTISHKDVMISVVGDHGGSTTVPREAKIYLFTPAGSYLGQNQETDASGRVVFSLPNLDYKVRVDYLGQHYWSEAFNQAGQTVSISEGVAEVFVNQGGTPLAGVRVYLFTDEGSYLGVNMLTEANGVASFLLPEGNYKFRADYHGSMYWLTGKVMPHQANDFNLDLGGGVFTLTVDKGAAMPITDIKVYAFTGSGSYLGLNQTTDANGQVLFDLSAGDYRFRVDYLGYRFWTGVISIPSTLSENLTIPHQEVKITVNETYGDSITPISGVKAYLFNGADLYMGISAATDANGQAVFNLPERGYKFRADYMGRQYWSDPVTWQDFSLNINHGQADVHVTMNGIDRDNVPVYLFSDTGAYLGRMAQTDAAGSAEFMVPAKSYKFRADYGGTQYWSDVINVLGDEQAAVEMALDLLAVNETNNPNPSRYDGEAPIRKILVADAGGTVLAEPLYSAADIYYYINDHLGTPQLLLDKNGEAVWQGNQKPFGSVTADPEKVANIFRFPGQMYDAETGLYYNWNRYYDPDTGRYLNPDPIGLKGGVNMYGYANSNPVVYIDQDGLAYFAYRPLRGPAKVFGVIGGQVDDYNNTVIGHEQLFFEDGKPESNVGFFDNGEILTETDTSGYRQPHDTGWNDCVMRKAVERVSNRRYKLLWERGTGYKYNCQDWADEVRRVYRMLIKDSAILQKCNPSCNEVIK